MHGRTRRSSLPEHLLREAIKGGASSAYANLRINVGGTEPGGHAGNDSPIHQERATDGQINSKPNSPFFSPKHLPSGRSPGAIISIPAKGTHPSLWRRKERNSPKNHTDILAGGSPPIEPEALKLAPILAKRLADDKLVSSSGGSSSSGSSSQRRPSDADRSTDLPHLLRRLEGRHGKSINLVGTSNLSQVVSQHHEETTASKPSSSQFELARDQAMKDLTGLKKEAMSARERLTPQTHPGSEELDLIDRLVDLIDEALTSSIEDFKINLTDIVDCVEEDRSQIDDASIKSLYTRLIFVLSRCSRLLITEQLHMFAREPQSRRFPTSMSRTAAQTIRVASPEEDDDEGAIFRNHTMPVKVMKVCRVGRVGRVGRVLEGFQREPH